MERQSEILIEPDEYGGAPEQVDPRASMVAETVVKLTAHELFATPVLELIQASGPGPEPGAPTTKGTTVKYTTDLGGGASKEDSDGRGDPD